MKKNKEIAVLIMMITMIVLMGIINRKSGALEIIAVKSQNHSESILKQELPILKMSSTSNKNVFSQIYEENEEEDEQVKIEIDSSHTSPILPKNGGKILVYHTHITEAFKQTDSYKYQESGSFRTNEMDKNISHIGSLLTNELQNYGLDVTHDTTNCEPPKLGTAYTRSLQMLEKRIKNEGQYDIYIDIHRDAYEKADDVVIIDGKRVAKVMLVVGTGQGNNGTPILPQPDYKSNYAFAKQITDNINAQYKGLAKDVRVNKSRYNQHISKHAILIEMGYTGNNMEEVENAVPYVAKAISQMIEE